MQIIEAIHDSKVETVIAVTGGGVESISRLLQVPGASRTVLEAIVPYSTRALSDWLGRQPDKFCCPETALAMATVAHRRAQQLASENTATIGIGCTAAISSDRPKAGDHRCFVALQSDFETRLLACTLAKGQRDRLSEDSLISDIIINELGLSAGLTQVADLPLRTDDVIERDQHRAVDLLAELYRKNTSHLWYSKQASFHHTPVETPKALLAGSFNPRHLGHQEMRAAAEQLLQGPVYYELTIDNADKPPLDFITIRDRISQFTDFPIALTNAPTFQQKADAFPETIFVVGVDTAARIVLPKYYDDVGGLDAALSRLRDFGCRFLVAGRREKDNFVTLSDIAIPDKFEDLFIELPESAFRRDLSSTELRSSES